MPYETDISTSILKLRPPEYQGNYKDITPLSEAELFRCFDTTNPTREMIEDNLNNAAEEENDLYQNIHRGRSFYVVTYKNGKPSEIFFGGYTYD